MHAYPLENPFLALRPFTREEAARFYGRDADLVLIQSRLYSSRTTLLFAGSGVGKTSLIDARLWPVLERQWRVVPHRQWAARPPLDALCAAIDPDASAADIQAASSLELLLRNRYGQEPPHQYLLILDQFEEVFQHWRDSKPLDAFANELACLVHSNTINARVLFSMREEFLGELSIFDNLIPDLFNNCYRLKNPTRAEAEEIIEKTAYSEQGVECGPGLEPLLDDLLATPRGAAPSTMAAATSPRSRIPMPFLQIVCHRLWEQQLGRKRPAGDTSDHFVDGHRPGAAAAELDGYCREKLDALTEPERDIAAAAFGFLMTPGGAKMAYPVDVLATQARVPDDQLLAVLTKLCARDVRILREIPAGPGSHPWFELYHDLYARFLSNWKRAHDQAKEEEATRLRREEQEERFAARVREAVEHTTRGRRTRTFRWFAAALALLLLAAVPSLNIYANYRDRYLPLKQYAFQASPSPDPEAHSAAANAFAVLKDSRVFSGRAKALWAHYWDQRAQREMFSGAIDQAILSQSLSLQEVDDGRVRRQFNHWLGFGETQRIYRSPEPVITFGYSAPSNRVFGVLSECRIVFWDRATAQPLPAWIPDKDLRACDSVKAVSPDGDYAILVGRATPVRNEPVTELTLALVELKSRRVPWRTKTSLFSRTEVSFSPDSRHVLVQIEGGGIVVSTATGSQRPLDIQVGTATDRPSGDFRYSPFTGNLVVKVAHEIVVFQPDGGSSGKRISWADKLAQFPDLARSGLPVIPLPGDRFAAVSPKKVHRLSLSEGVATAVDASDASFDISPQAYSVAPDGSRIFLRQLRDEGFDPRTPIGLCVLTTELSGCEMLAWPLGELMDGFTATSADSIVVADISGQTLREIRLAKSSAPAALETDASELVLTSADGRWGIAQEDAACYLVDPSGKAQKREIAKSCFGPGFQFVFSPSGRRLLDMASDRNQPTVIDPVSLRSQALPEPTPSAQWASDDYLTFTRDGTTVLLNVVTGRAEPLESASKLTAQPGRQPSMPNCAQTPSSAVVSPNGRYAAVPEPNGLKLYQHADNKWAVLQAIPNATMPCVLTFSTDSSRLLGLVNGNVVSIWKTEDGNGVRSLTDNFQLLTTSGFGLGRDSVVAVANQLGTSELILWALDGSELPFLRATAPSDLFLRSHPESNALAAEAGRMLAWLSSSTRGDIDMTVRPSFWHAESSPGATMAADGTVRKRIKTPGGRWITLSLDPGFSDVQPFALSQGKSWLDLYKEWSRQFDLRLEETTGRYQPITAVAPLPVAPPEPSQRRQSAPAYQSARPAPRSR